MVLRLPSARVEKVIARSAFRDEGISNWLNGINRDCFAALAKTKSRNFSTLLGHRRKKIKKVVALRLSIRKIIRRYKPLGVATRVV
jgi:hypothetical protein